MNNNSHNQASKAEVQSTELNKMPAAQSDTEFSAEQAAEAFTNQSSAAAQSAEAQE
ncbi:hypothetical protein [Paenibacillus terrigena]|uniref:hypothetical protein n=1 Tax=Paenibacillus terrigena TaxID=369333 RepID=UPI0028D0B609|nr:hypothetical protein [Paenibacillus terrigena]